jgi:hypothetical protein
MLLRMTCGDLRGTHLRTELGTSQTAARFPSKKPWENKALNIGTAEAAEITQR